MTHATIQMWKKKKVTFSARNLILLLSPLKRNNHPSLTNDYYSVSSSFSQCFSGIISGAWGFRLSKLHLFPSSFWWPPHQGPSKFLQSRGREALAIMCSGELCPSWLYTLLKRPWSCLFQTGTQCWKGGGPSYRLTTDCSLLVLTLGLLQSS